MNKMTQEKTAEAALPTWRDYFDERRARIGARKVELSVLTIAHIEVAMRQAYNLAEENELGEIALALVEFEEAVGVAVAAHVAAKAAAKPGQEN